MANGSFIAVTPGSGAKLATGPTYTENSNVVQDEKVILGLQYLAEYRTVTGSTGVSAATADSHLIQIMAGSTLNVYIPRIRVYQFGAATTAILGTMNVVRLTSAGTGGGVPAIAPVDTTDAAAGATAMTLPTVKGSEGAAVDQSVGYFVQTVSASLGIPLAALIYDIDFRGPRGKVLRIPAGTANGIAVKQRTAVAAATVVLAVELFEAPY